MKKSVVNIFKKLAKLFKVHGYNLYMVGGTSRDYIMSRHTLDLDLATDALVDEMIKILPPEYDVRTPFKKYGNLKIKMEDVLVDITTLRVEEEYLDHRHPTKIKFVKELELDSNRRDFTINALYIDDTLANIYDYHDGVNDLIEHRIRMIGDPDTRIKEDPLRILRALRFSLKLNFVLEESLIIAIKKHIPLLSTLNPLKIKEEIQKMDEINPIKTKIILQEYGITI